ncbi:cupin [Aquabacterium fontiphilum]|uniref:cupin n=1 Tax=Aquabacterium fontiphilum TaxID=450365 RepID=UPI0013767469|nr:cupin [Aquabacterium fontiphilum]NBD20507.1 cupin [Aquabacterium fontiphilum]
MALPHAHPMEVIDLAPLGARLADTPSTSLIRAEGLQLLHIVLRDGQDQPLHSVACASVLHCLEGRVEVFWPGGVLPLQAGRLVVLPGGQVHGLRARSDAAVLVTLLAEHAAGGDQR